MKLTKRTVDAATYEGGRLGSGFRRCILWDEEPRGFGLRVFPSGRKTFVLFYRANGRQRLATLGAYGVLTVEDARKKAKRLLLSVDDGADPVAERREERGEPTLADFATRYLAEHARPKKKPASVRTDESLLARHVLPGSRGQVSAAARGAPAPRPRGPGPARGGSRGGGFWRSSPRF